MVTQFDSSNEGWGRQPTTHTALQSIPWTSHNPQYIQWIEVKEAFKIGSTGEKREERGGEEEERRKSYIGVELTHKTGQIVVLEILGEHILGKLGGFPHHKTGAVVVPRHHIVAAPILHQLVRLPQKRRHRPHLSQFRLLKPSITNTRFSKRKTKIKSESKRTSILLGGRILRTKEQEGGEELPIPAVKPREKELWVSQIVLGEFELLPIGCSHGWISRRPESMGFSDDNESNSRARRS